MCRTTRQATSVPGARTAGRSCCQVRTRECWRFTRSDATSSSANARLRTRLLAGCLRGTMYSGHRRSRRHATARPRTPRCCTGAWWHRAASAKTTAQDRVPAAEGGQASCIYRYARRGRAPHSAVTNLQNAHQRFTQCGARRQPCCACLQLAAACSFELQHPLTPGSPCPCPRKSAATTRRATEDRDNVQRRTRASSQRTSSRDVPSVELWWTLESDARHVGSTAHAWACVRASASATAVGTTRNAAAHVLKCRRSSRRCPCCSLRTCQTTRHHERCRPAAGLPGHYPERGARQELAARRAPRCRAAHGSQATHRQQEQ